MLLNWHDYSYYPYERELAAREVAALFGDSNFREIPTGLELEGVKTSGPAGRLTYFSSAVTGRRVMETLQGRLERAVRTGKSRQATRYSVHGLHEYKGKFNPQVAKALLNIFGVRADARVLDPFCGSGTTLVECAHFGVSGLGVDLNPFAVFLANAKLHALATPVPELRTKLERLTPILTQKTRSTACDTSPRIEYLRSWFGPDVLDVVETIRTTIEDSTGGCAPILLAIASNLLRDYSQQDPKDLRIRRRRTPLPNTPFPEAFFAACAKFFKHLDAAQAVLGTNPPVCAAELGDAAAIALGTTRFDVAITSPPYAMALPYIDTQRLSLIWLGLLKPSEISRVESELIGSREFRGDARRKMISALEENAEVLPEAQVGFCQKLQDSLSASDGFRRQAVPTLLYRYLTSMRNAFQAVRLTMKRGAPFALIVGRNHTVIGGVRYDIDTPAHLAALAVDAGWTVQELLPLQTYHRYGYHVANAVRAETLVILRNS